jgi:hypothetical protein
MPGIAWLANGVEWSSIRMISGKREGRRILVRILAATPTTQIRAEARISKRAWRIIEKNARLDPERWRLFVSFEPNDEVTVTAGPVSALHAEARPGIGLQYIR